jgi:hypothetical protein
MGPHYREGKAAEVVELVETRGRLGKVTVGALGGESPSQALSVRCRPERPNPLLAASNS